MSISSVSSAFILSLITSCVPDVHPSTMYAIVKTESGFNQFAIGIVNGKLSRQPQNKKEAIVTVSELEKLGFNYSIGLMQVNKINLKPQNLNNEKMFSPCENLRAGANILKSCYTKAINSKLFSNEQESLEAALSCYYSGNFKRGFKLEKEIDNKSYVQRVIANSTPITITNTKGGEKYTVPAINNDTDTNNKISLDISEKTKDTSIELTETITPQESQKERDWIISESKNSWDIFNDFKGDRND